MIHLHEHGVSLTDAAKEKIHTKAQRLRRFDREMQDESTKINVEFHAEPPAGVRCGVTIEVPHPHARLHAEGRADSALAAFDGAEQAIKKQIEKHKSAHLKRS